jgi:DNA-binding protein YbaB
MFDKMKALMDMQKKMSQLKRELDNTNFEVTSTDGSIKITMNGSQEVKEIKINSVPAGELEGLLKDTFNRAIRRSHELAAEKTKELTGFGLPGLP